ncbi:hypothetical protein GGH99_001935, partial [Coemansia sp. RSA 1285]
SDKRIATISEVLHGIKVVKLFGWETRFLEKVDKHREKQLSYAWKVFIWVTSISVSAYLNPIIILVIMFTSYVVVFGNTLNAEIAFTSIVVFQMVSGAIKRLPKYINVAIGGYVSISRIDSYLEQPQIQDLEKRTPTQVFNNELGFSCADLEWTTSDSPKIVESANNSDGYNELRRINSTVNTQPMENTPLMAKIPRRQTTLSLRSSATRIANQNDIMRFSLRDIDVKFPLGGLSIVAGPTGSGKSSLLTALVGEMTLVRGRVLLPTIHPNVLAENNTKYRNVIELSNEGTTIHDIAYVAQEAWLRNATIRENILFGEPYDRERYEEVLRVCALKPDLRVLVAGDRTEVGEHGIILSGGQKQRISLARAVYSSRRILLIDDCLSAVDAHTAKHILVECLAGNTKLTHGRTRVLVTHHVAMCLPYAQFSRDMDIIDNKALDDIMDWFSKIVSVLAIYFIISAAIPTFAIAAIITTCIEDLVVEYVPGVPVLRGISLSVKHGENVGVVGRTGAGKSTISLALMRFIEASKGRIVMDGVDISKIGLEDLRRNVTIIPQDPVLFNGTIRFNLDPFDEHPDELLWDALRRTHLAREDDTQPNSSATSVIEIASSIDSNEHGVERMAGIFTSLDTKIKENGKSLSSGQRQLMALARALVRRSKVIIMDEATASVDFDTDNRIQRAIHGPEFANSTLFCIAHRLRTIVDYDKVLVLENGKVAEFDTPHNLLQNKSGIFWSMCKESGEYKHLAGLAASRNNSTNGLFSH